MIQFLIEHLMGLLIFTQIPTLHYGFKNIKGPGTGDYNKKPQLTVYVIYLCLNSASLNGKTVLLVIIF